MGNQNSSNSKPHSGSPVGSNHHHSGQVRKPREGIQPPSRAAASAEASLAQAQGRTTLPHRPRASPSPANALHNDQPLSPTTMGSTQSKASDQRHKAQRDTPSKPLAVPTPSSAASSPSRATYSHVEASGSAYQHHVGYNPPRLPLPIEEEVHTPGSPIIAPADGDAPILDIESLEGDSLTRKTSGLSSTTVDEDEEEELPVDQTKATVPTEISWHRGGGKVYVTGTIFQWNRKHRLHPVEGHPGTMSATIHVRPGTHHVRFIVDGNMTTSPDLPTTVDFGNNLVNYIEVSADDLPPPPTTEDTSGVPSTEDSKGTSAHVENKAPDAATKPVKTKPVLPDKEYTSKVPQYLVDLDKPEDSRAFQHASKEIEKLPTPPSLPGFLGKPILNAATPMKDDNSVLNMPNHTVLNHLATSSIKNNVLAVSATTRYKRKYVTTIMYKPTSDDTS